MRFSEEEAVKSGDGLWVSSLGIPSLGKYLGPLLMKTVLNPKSEIKRWEKILRRSAGFIMFLTDSDSPENMIRLGQTFQRFGLTAASLNLSHSHVNMPCEVHSVRTKMKHELMLDSQPMLLIRYGYGKPEPYSFRRNLNAIMKKQKGV